MSRFREHGVKHTIAFFGSARTLPRSEAQKQLNSAKSALKRSATKKNKDAVQKAEGMFKMSRYYEDARTLARMLTEWSAENCPVNETPVVICSGGAAGIMEAANRGAADVKGARTVGLNISLPFEQAPNPYITPELSLEFHYFFMRKLWFSHLARAIVVFPGGFGTCDEFVEILTLIQTKKYPRIPIVLFGTEFWDGIINFEKFVEWGAISPGDLSLFKKCGTVQEAFDYLTTGMDRFVRNGC